MTYPGSATFPGSTTFPGAGVLVLPTPAKILSEWVVLARNSDRSIAGILRSWSLSLTLRFNEVGTWTLNVPREVCPSGWPAAGSGIIVLHNGVVRASGMIDNNDYKRAADPASPDVSPGLWTLTGDTDLGRIAYRVVYPVPGSSWETQTAASHYVLASAIAETQLRTLVNVNAGPGALVARRVPGLVLGTATGAGTSVPVRERFTMLLDTCRAIALSGGGLGFDVINVPGGNYEFHVYQPVDRTLTARFGEDLGNVLRLSVGRLSPEVTVALIAGPGEQASRITDEQIDTTADPAWGRREMFIDQRQASETDPVARQAEFDKAATEALAAGAEQATISADIIDTATTQWGRDYNLGDKVSVNTPHGVVPDLVREVHVDVSEEGEAVVGSTIGTTQASSASLTVRLARSMQKRISNLERSA